MAGLQCTAALNKKKKVCRSTIPETKRPPHFCEAPIFSTDQNERKMASPSFSPEPGPLTLSPQSWGVGGCRVFGNWDALAVDEIRWHLRPFWFSHLLGSHATCLLSLWAKWAIGDPVDIISGLTASLVVGGWSIFGGLVVQGGFPFALYKNQGVKIQIRTNPNHQLTDTWCPSQASNRLLGVSFVEVGFKGKWAGKYHPPILGPHHCLSLAASGWKCSRSCKARSQTKETTWQQDFGRASEHPNRTRAILCYCFALLYLFYFVLVYLFTFWGFSKSEQQNRLFPLNLPPLGLTYIMVNKESRGVHPNQNKNGSIRFRAPLVYPKSATKVVGKMKHPISGPAFAQCTHFQKMRNVVQKR